MRGEGCGCRGMGWWRGSSGGPPARVSPPRTQVVACRRYRCQACGAVMTVLPGRWARRVATGELFAELGAATAGRAREVAARAAQALPVSQQAAP
jgi:hypothetical protein